MSTKECVQCVEHGLGSHGASGLDHATDAELECGMSAWIDDTVQQIVAAAARSLALKRAILFGSRARNDARSDSDIDLAFEHGSSDAEWAAFVNEMADSAPTLLGLDLVDLARVSPPLRDQILSEGRVVHG